MDEVVIFIASINDNRISIEFALTEDVCDHFNEYDECPIVSIFCFVVKQMLLACTQITTSFLYYLS